MVINGGGAGSRSASGARLAVLMGAILAAGCGGPRCENTAFFGLPSPDGVSIAFVFHRRCDAGKRITTDVSVMDFHSSLRNEPGNVLAVGNEQPVRVSWLGPRKLLVTGFAAPLYQRATPVGTIAVEFRSAARADAGPH